MPKHLLRIYLTTDIEKLITVLTEDVPLVPRLDLFLNIPFRQFYIAIAELSCTSPPARSPWQGIWGGNIWIPHRSVRVWHRELWCRYSSCQEFSRSLVTYAVIPRSWKLENQTRKVSIRPLLCCKSRGWLIMSGTGFSSRRCMEGAVTFLAPWMSKCGIEHHTVLSKGPCLISYH